MSWGIGEDESKRLLVKEVLGRCLAAVDAQLARTVNSETPDSPKTDGGAK